MRAFVLIFTLFVLQTSSGAVNFPELFRDQRLSYVETHFNHGRYIMPNEDDFYLFDKDLHNKTDVIISVGTFRSFENASRGNFSHLVLLDIDREVVKFNREQIEILKNSPTRREFIANLMGDSNFFKKYSFLDRYLQNSQLQKLASFLDSSHSKTSTQGNQDNLLIRRYYLKAILQLCDVSRGEKAGFLISEERYRLLHQMAVQDRMAAVRADLVDVGLHNVGLALQQANLKVSVLDVSNAPDYFLQEDTRNAGAFYESLKAVPFSADARILSTTGIGARPRVNQKEWFYLSFSATEYMEHLTGMKDIGAYRIFVGSPEGSKGFLNPKVLQCTQIFFKN